MGVALEIFTILATSRQLTALWVTDATLHSTPLFLLSRHISAQGDKGLSPPRHHRGHLRVHLHHPVPRADPGLHPRRARQGRAPSVDRRIRETPADSLARRLQEWCGAGEQMMSERQNAPSTGTVFPVPDAEPYILQRVPRSCARTAGPIHGVLVLRSVTFVRATPKSPFARQRHAIVLFQDLRQTFLCILSGNSWLRPPTALPDDMVVRVCGSLSTDSVRNSFASCSHRIYSRRNIQNCAESSACAASSLSLG